MRRATIIFSCLMAVSLAGCGGSASTSGPSGAASTVAGGATPTAASAAPVSTGTPGAVGSLPDACSLLTKAEIDGIVGHPVKAGATSISGECNWDRLDVHNISVTLRVRVLPGTLKCQTGGATPLDGFDVEAAWHFTKAAGTGSVTACPSRVQIQITLVGDNVTGTTPEDMLRADGVQLMHLALPRM